MTSTASVDACSLSLFGVAQYAMVGHDDFLAAEGRR
jgi:hypothetical protein